MYFFLAISTILNTMIAFIVGFLTYTKQKDSKLAKIFSIQCFLIGLWALLYFFPFFPEDKLINLISFHALHLGSNFITITHLVLVTKLLKIDKEQKKVIWSGYIIHTILLFFIPTELFIKDVVPKLGFYYWAEIGPIYHVWMLSWSFFMIYSTWLLWVHYKKAEGLKKQQIKYFLFGTILGITAGSLNFLPFYNIGFPYYFNILSSFYVLSIAYLIARYRFFNIKLNFLNTVHKTISFLLAFVSLYFIYSYINHFFEVPNNVQTDIVLLLASLFLYHFFETVINMKYFSKFFHLSDYEKFNKTIKKFIKNHDFRMNLKDLEKKIKIIFIKRLHFKKVKLIIVNKDFEKKYPTLFLHFTHKKIKNPVILSELELAYQDKKEKKKFLIKEVQKLGEAIFPIYNIENKLMGFLILGEKSFGNPYYTEEVGILKEFCDYLGLSLTVINYHKNLAKEVREKTKQLNNKNNQLKESYKELQKMDEVKDEFLAIASHELRTPLSIIKGYTDFLLQEKFGKINEKQTDFLGKIFKSTDSLLDLINKMLDISHIESGKMEFKPESINIFPYLNHIKKEFSILFKNKKIKLEIKNPQKIFPQVFVDPEKLHIIFTNLLGNAYKFTPEKGKVVIEVVKKSKKFIKISVIDNGIGIPKEKHKYIFKKFQQVENSLQKEYTGTGLGLNITEKIIEKFGGKIWVESSEKEKNGSIFHFTLPIKIKNIKK